jgi:hypothetical protein
MYSFIDVDFIYKKYGENNKTQNKSPYKLVHMLMIPDLQEAIATIPPSYTIYVRK